HLEIFGDRCAAVGGERLAALLQVLLERTTRVGVLGELDADLTDVIEYPVVRYELIGAIELDQRQGILALLVELEAAIEALLRLEQDLRRGGRRCGGRARRGARG